MGARVKRFAAGLVIGLLFAGGAAVASPWNATVESVQLERIAKALERLVEILEERKATATLQVGRKNNAGVTIRQRAQEVVAGDGQAFDGCKNNAGVTIPCREKP